MDPSPLSNTSAVVEAPAPWQLQGDGTILAVKFTPERLRDNSFLPAPLQDRLRPGLSLVMVVNYESSNVGPYRELLFIPGRVHLHGRWVWSISRIFVDSRASVINGRRNWGIPKDYADFDIERSQNGAERVRVTREGTPVADLSYQPKGPSLPGGTILIPPSLRRLGQYREQTTYFYTPGGRGRAQWTRYLGGDFNAREFPDLNQARVMAAFRVNRFQLGFPVSTTHAGLD